MKTRAKFVVAMIVALASTSANAWGDRERSALIGFAVGAALFSGAQANARIVIPGLHAQDVAWVAPSPVYVYPQVGYSRQDRFVDPAVVEAYERGVADRLRDDRQRAIRDAYRAGYHLR